MGLRSKFSSLSISHVLSIVCDEPVDPWALRLSGRREQAKGDLTGLRSVGGYPALAVLLTIRAHPVTAAASIPSRLHVLVP